MTTLKLDDVNGLNVESKERLRNLSNIRPPIGYDKGKQAAVMVALFIGRFGDLHVLLSQRSDFLSSYPGDTCLIGGRKERSDVDVEYTARREAEEEIGLPIDYDCVRYVATLPPHLAGYGISAVTVWPIVCLITDRALVPMLNEDEVQRIFSHPLESFLSHKPDRLLLRLGHLEDENSAYHWHFDDVDPVSNRHRLRKHVFETGRNTIKPILGFTARVMIRVAEIACQRPASFIVDAPSQIPELERVNISQVTVPSARL